MNILLLDFTDRGVETRVSQGLHVLSAVIRYGCTAARGFGSVAKGECITMNCQTVASDVLDAELLGVRAKLLEIAGTLDRLNRAEGSVEDDPRIAQIREALEVLQAPQSDRAERIQLIFSLPYKDQWRESYRLDTSR